MRILCVVPARGGSKGVPGKNLREVAGKPLLVWTVEQARAARPALDVVVSTDDEQIAEVARAAGAAVPFLRPPELARDTTPTEPVVRHALEAARAAGAAPDAVMLLQATSPVRLPGTIDRAVRLLGLGERAIVEVPALANGEMDAGALPATLAEREGKPTIVCAQAGNVNTGACDDLAAVAKAARAADAWIHVDGAFGLWAAASPRTAALVEGIELADSWACDGHKWLNIPYDGAYAFCAHPDVHATALAYTAEYLTGQVAGREFGGGDFVTESSRRARGFATWAALRSLGRTGVAELVDRCCSLARRFAAGLDEIEGVEVVNEVVLNQVLVRVGDADLTDRLERAIQDDGTCWMGATTWRGERLLRIAVSNWTTTDADVDLVVETIARLRAELTGAST